MAKKTIADINIIKENFQNQNDSKNDITKIYVHMGTCGIASGAAEILTILKKDIKDNSLKI